MLLPARARLGWRHLSRLKKKNGPQKPNGGLGHEHEALWGFMMHLNGRIDGLYVLAVVGVLGVVVVFVAVVILCQRAVALVSDRAPSKAACVGFLTGSRRCAAHSLTV